MSPRRLLSCIPTAGAARAQARLALAAGEYAAAADRYALAAQRLGPRVLAPRFTHTLFPCEVRACVLAAARVDLEEGDRTPEALACGTKLLDRLLQRTLGVPYDPAPPDDQFVSAHVGFHLSTYRPPAGLSRHERLLLLLHRPLDAPTILVDLHFDPMVAIRAVYMHKYAPIEHLFAIRMFEARAAQGDARAFGTLGMEARMAPSAERALLRLATQRLPGASKQLEDLHLFRHERRKRREQEHARALDEEADRLRYSIFSL